MTGLCDYFIDFPDMIKFVSIFSFPSSKSPEIEALDIAITKSPFGKGNSALTFTL